MGDVGDTTRQYVLDAPMMAALPDSGRILDIGCGEGRFCRMMSTRGLTVVGLDPTEALRARAQTLDPQGRYIAGRAEALPFEAASFDGVVFYMSLIDIPDFRLAINEAARVLRPGGRLLVGNLQSFVTARPRDWDGEGSHWVIENGRQRYMAVDDMLLERGYVAAWGDIRITNYHRPMSAYMTAFLDAGLHLRCYEDPPCLSPDPDLNTRYERMPWAVFMVWDKPERTDDD